MYQLFGELVLRQCQSPLITNAWICDLSVIHADVLSAISLQYTIACTELSTNASKTALHLANCYTLTETFATNNCSKEQKKTRAT